MKLSEDELKFWRWLYEQTNTNQMTVKEMIDGRIAELGLDENQVVRDIKYLDEDEPDWYRADSLPIEWHSLLSRGWKIRKSHSLTNREGCKYLWYKPDSVCNSLIYAGDICHLDYDKGE